MSTKTINGFFCGGAGINVGKSFVNKPTLEGLASIEPIFCDTSESNIRGLNTRANKINFELVPDTDGSGGIRGENNVAIADIVNAILNKYDTTRLNIVCFSASGGSGSVFGPLIASELLKREAPIILMVIGSEESKLRIINTIKTLKSLDNIATNIIKKPIVMYYAHNLPGAKFSVTDNQIIGAITSISVLASGLNEGLDSKDLYNFLMWTVISSAKPQLSLLEIISTVDAETLKKIPVSLASLYRNEDTPRVTLISDYDCYGYVSDPDLIKEDLHFVITNDNVVSIAQSVNERVNDIESKANARSNQTSITDKNDVAQDNGLIL